MESILDDFEFISANQLAECLQDWMTSPDLCAGKILYIEDGQGDILKRAVLLEKTLSDGSKVYNVRLS